MAHGREIPEQERTPEQKYRHEHYMKNREKILLYYKNQNKIPFYNKQNKSRARTWYLANKERADQTRRVWYAIHRDEILRKMSNRTPEERAVVYAREKINKAKRDAKKEAVNE